jgi:hypothetical protein
MKNQSVIIAYESEKPCALRGKKKIAIIMPSNERERERIFLAVE